MAGVHRFVQQFEEQVHLGGGFLGLEVLQLEQVQMAADLPQAQQRVENLELGALESLCGHQVDDLAAGILEQGRVDLLLVAAEGAGGDALDLGRQFLGHVALHAAQQEGLQLAAQLPLGQLAFGTALRDGLLDVATRNDSRLPR